MEAFTPASAALMVYMALLSALAFGIWRALLKHNPVGRVTGCRIRNEWAPQPFFVALVLSVSLRLSGFNVLAL